jgi:hypothetical protein
LLGLSKLEAERDNLWKYLPDGLSVYLASS